MPSKIKMQIIQYRKFRIWKMKEYIYIYRQNHCQESGLCDISYTRYSGKCVTQICKALYGDAMLVSLWGAQICLPETNRNICLWVFLQIVNSLLKELIKVNILFWGKECSDSKIYQNRSFPCHQLMHCHTSCRSLTWAPIPMRPSLRHSIAYLYPCPTWPRTQLSGTYGNVQTYKKYMPVQVLLWSKFWLPFSFQL